MDNFLPNTVWTMLAVSLFALTAPVDGSRNVVCYYTNWPQYRPGEARYTVQNVNPRDCTHLMFAFAKIVDSKLKPYEYNDMTPNGGAYKALTDLKKQNPSLLTYLAVGGWNHGPTNFTLMSASRQNRRVFIQDSIYLLRRFNFDGIDLDWEYPGKLEPSDKQHLSELLLEMKSEFRKEAARSNQKPLLLSMALGAGIEVARKAYDVPVLDRTLDMYNLMTYDFHGAWEKFTGLATPMTSNKDTMSVQHAVDWYISQGASPNKINLGIAFYARSWTLADTSNTGLGAPASGKGTAGRYTREGGVLSYYEVCQAMYRENGVAKLDYLGQTNYVVLGDQFITFENKASITYKLDYIVRKGLAGAMVWSLDHDDFNGQFCGQGSSPLLSVVKEKMAAAPSLPGTGTGVVTYPPRIITTPTTPYQRTTRRRVVTNPVTHVTVTSGHWKKKPNCPYDEAKVADPNSCNKYYVCIRFLRLGPINCRNNEIFNPNSERCESRSSTTYMCQGK